MTWVLVGPSGQVTDGPCEMTANQAMGINQVRALNGMYHRWEEYNAEQHGTLEEVRAAVRAMDENEILRSPDAE